MAEELPTEIVSTRSGCFATNISQKIIDRSRTVYVNLHTISENSVFPIVSPQGNSIYVGTISHGKTVSTPPLGKSCYVDSTGNIWAIRSDNGQFIHLIPPYDNYVEGNQLTNTNSGVFTLSDSNAYVAGENSVVSYTFITDIDETPVEMYYDKTHECVCALTPHYIYLIHASSNPHPEDEEEGTLLDSYYIGGGGKGLAIDKFKRYWALVGNSIKVFKVNSERKLVLDETKGFPYMIFSWDVETEAYTVQIAENSNFDIMVTIRTPSEAIDPWGQEDYGGRGYGFTDPIYKGEYHGGSPAPFVWTASSDYNRPIRATLSHRINHYYENVIPLQNGAWLIPEFVWDLHFEKFYEDEIFHRDPFWEYEWGRCEHYYYVFELWSQLLMRKNGSLGRYARGDPGCTRHLTWGTATPKIDDLLKV